MHQVFNSQGLPKREGEEECKFFCQNGECKFRLECKFHHPEFIYPDVDFNSKGFPLRPGQPDCEFYLKRRECKFGCTCSKNHPEFSDTINLQGPANIKPLAQPSFKTDPKRDGERSHHKFSSQRAPFQRGFTQDDGKRHRDSGLGRSEERSRSPRRSSRTTTMATNAHSLNSLGYPIRPLAEKCTFYMQNGSCRFGVDCQFTHPEKRSRSDGREDDSPRRVSHAAGYSKSGLPLRPGVQVCAFFAKTGDCKYGSECKWDHTEKYAGTKNEDKLYIKSEGVEMNSAGLPIRPGQPVCEFFAKTGQCSFGDNCKFDHPEEYCHLANLPREDGGPKKADILTSAGLPSRPGEQPCSFFLKTGSCKYGSTCKWDHPEDKVIHIKVSSPSYKEQKIRASPY